MSRRDERDAAALTAIGDGDVTTARDAAKLLGECVAEARANDDAWTPFALRHEGRVEGYETAREVFERALALTGARPSHRGPVRAEGCAPVAIKDCSTGAGLTLGDLAATFGPDVEHVAMVWVGSRWAPEGVIARGATLGELLPKLSRAEVRQAGREGVLTVVNAWTREEMTPAAAAALAGGLGR